MSKSFVKRVISSLATLAFVVGLVVLSPKKADAIPAFSRMYGTSCSTCHVDFPKLNDFGKAFKDAGFKFPKDDETFVKVQPVMLGSPAQKELWPKTIWPGSIPGMPPIGLRYNQFFQVVSRDSGKLAPTDGFIPRTDFQPGYFSIFTAGNFGSGIAFWVDDDISVAGDNSNGSLGDGYLKFVDLGRFAKLPKDSLSLRAGQFELDLPFTQARSYDLSNYDIYSEANVGGPLQPSVNNVSTLTNPGRGVEVSGGHNYGGYHYSVAFIDQNTNPNTLVAGSTTTLPSANAVSFVSDSNFKDIYARFAYRFNLERNKASRNDVQAAGPMGPRDHTSLRVGSYYFYGRSAQTFGTTTTSTVHEPFYRVGGDLDFHYRNFNIYGLYMYARDHNVLVDPVSGDVLGVGAPAHFSGSFVQADYLALPWLMTIMRWDRVQSSADAMNAMLSVNGANPTFWFDSTRNRFTPGVQFLIHANIKASFEYQIRPRQAVVADEPFRTNTALTALEFVY